MGTARSDWVSRQLGGWVTGVLRYRRLTIVGFLLVTAFGLGYTPRHLGIDTDTSDMISSELPWRQNYIEYRDQFPTRDRNLIVVVDSPVPEAAAAFAGALVERLAAHPELYGSVFLPAHDPFFERNGLLYLDVASLESLSDRLAAVQPLLGRLQQELGGARLIELLTEVLTREPSRAGELEPLLTALARVVEAAADGRREALSWQALLGRELRAAEPELVLIEPVPDLTRMLPATAAIETLRQEIAELARADPAAQVRARITGVVAMEHEELVSVSRGAGWAGAAALLMVGVVLLAALRSVKLLLLSLTTLLVGLSWTATFAAWSVGHLNLLSVAFAVLYVGLGVDFLLHIALRLRELATAPRPLAQALVESVRSIGPSLVICAVTTAAAFYSFIPTQFQGVSELGLISGTGMLVSLFTSVTLYPALLAEFCTEADLRPLAAGRARGLGQALLRRPRGILAGTAVVSVAAALALPQVRFDNNPIHLRDPTSESVATVRELAARGSAPPMALVAVAPSRAVANQWAEELAALPLVREARTLDSWVPGEQAEKIALLDDLALLLGPGFAEVERRGPDPARLAAALRELQRTLEVLPAPSAAQQALVARLARLPAAAEAEGESAAERLAALDQDLVTYLPAQLARLERALGARAFTRADLPRSLAERWVGAQGQELVEISPAENTYDNAAARRFVAAARSAVATVTGLPIVHHEASATVIEAFRLAFAYALIMVLVVLWFFELRFIEAALIIGPVLLASVVTAAATVALGVDFNFANIIALPLLLGVGVDNGIHVVHRARHEASADLHNSTSRAVLASGLTTIASFGNLAFSSHQGMASMGQLLTLGMIAALAASLLVLPALLVLLRRA